MSDGKKKHKFVIDVITKVDLANTAEYDSLALVLKTDILFQIVARRGIHERVKSSITYP